MENAQTLGENKTAQKAGPVLVKMPEIKIGKLHRKIMIFWSKCRKTKSADYTKKSPAFCRNAENKNQRIIQKARRKIVNLTTKKSDEK